MTAFGLLLWLAPASAFAAQPPCGPGDMAAAVANCPEKLVPAPQRAQDPAVVQRMADAFLEIKRANDREQKLHVLINNLDGDIAALPLRGYFDKVALKKERDAKARELQESLDHNADRHNAALAATIEAFGLTPAFTTPPPEVTLLHRMNQWGPRYTGCEARDAFGNCRELSSAERKALEVVQLGETKHEGGQIWIFPAAFDSPERLATVVLHESIHWIHTVKRMGTPPTPYEYFASERVAYALQADAAGRLGLKEEGEWRARSGKEGINAEGVRGRDWAWVRSHRPDLMRQVQGYAELAGASPPAGGDEAARAQAEADFLGSFARESQAFREARERASAEQEERAAREAADRLAARPPPAPAEDPYWEALRRWAGMACGYIERVDRVPVEDFSNPDAVGWAAAENERRFAAKRAADAVAREYLLHNLVVMEKGAIAARMSGDAGLGSCDRDMLRLIMSAEGPLAADWLVGQLDYRKGGGAVGAILHGIAQAVGGGASAVVRGAKAPFIAAGDALTASEEPAAPAQPPPPPAAPERPERPGRERAEPQEREHAPARTSEGGAMRQLRGVSSGSLRW